MKHHRRSIWLKLVLVSSLIIMASGALLIGVVAEQATLLVQNDYPAPPADRTLVYITDEKGALQPLTFEAGTTPLRVEEVAKSDKRSYLELKGEHSAVVINRDEPRFYLFVPDEPNAKPPFIVRLADKGKNRRVGVMAQKGYKWFAIDTAEIVKPHYRVLAREGGMYFMEIRTREPLMMGEYAIIGSDLQRIATFRIAPATN